MLNIEQKFHTSSRVMGQRSGRDSFRGKRSMAGEFASGLWMLLLGIFVGALFMALFLGFRSGSTNTLGAGIRDIVQRPSARVATNAPNAPAMPAQVAQPQPRQQTKLAAPTMRETVVSAPKTNSSVTFHEVLSQEANVLPRTVQRQTTTPEVSAVPKPSTPEEELTAAYEPSRSQLPASGTYYMLQVGSFVRYEEADRLKAQLTIAGLDARIQSATVRGTGVFRVRVGPYASYSDLGIVENRVRRLGHNPIQIKISQN